MREAMLQYDRECLEARARYSHAVEDARRIYELARAANLAAAVKDNNASANA
jgi:hypothetical protein